MLLFQDLVVTSLPCDELTVLKKGYGKNWNISVIKSIFRENSRTVTDGFRYFP